MFGFFRVWILDFGFSLVLDVLVFIGIRYVARLSEVKVLRQMIEYKQ